MEKRKYNFDWDTAVSFSIKQARPNLGPNTRVEIYRLLKYSIQQLLEEKLGIEETTNLFREAGIQSGKAFYSKFLINSLNITTLVDKIKESFNAMGIGIFKIESLTEDHSYFKFTIEEDLDCSGFPNVSKSICVYDEGFIKGILEEFSGKEYEVHEIDCWCTGSNICRFEAKLIIR